MIKKSIYLFLLFIAGNIVLLAQGGSNYSMFGVGDRLYSISSYYEGLGGSSIAVPSETAINTMNPALWGKNTTTRFQTGYRFNQHVNILDDFELWQNNGKINGFLAVFAIDSSSGFSMALGITPYSSVNFFVSTPVTKELEELKVEGKTEYQGAGGFNQGFIGASVRLIDELYLGADVFVNFGKKRTSDVTTFYTGSNYISVNYIDDNYVGMGYKGGLYYSFPFGLSLGAFYEHQLTTDVERKLTYVSSLVGDTTFSRSFDIQIPDLFGFGLSYKSGKFLFAGDYSVEDYKAFDYTPGVKTEFTSTQRITGGIARYGSKSLSAEFLDKITYKIGGGYIQQYYKVENSTITDIFGTVGFSVPMPGTGIIDLSFIFGNRGGEDKSLINEYYGRFVIDISIGETWFKPFKREY